MHECNECLHSDRMFIGGDPDHGITVCFNESVMELNGADDDDFLRIKNPCKLHTCRFFSSREVPSGAKIVEITFIPPPITLKGLTP